jgi:hypothetical protein
MVDDDSRLDALFQRYRAACPDVDPSANFMPRMWMKIEARRSFWFVFRRLAQAAMTACAALCLLLVALNVYSASQALLLAPSYTDALMADHTAEQTDYTEAIRSSEQ